MKRLTFDLLLAGTLAVAPLAWAQEPGAAGSAQTDPGSMQNRNDTRPTSPTRTGPAPSTNQRNTPPYPGDDPAAPQRVPSEAPPAGIPTPSTTPSPSTPSPRTGSDTTRGTTGTQTDPSTTTGSVRSGNDPTQTPPTTDTMGAEQGDLSFIARIHEANQKEITMGQLATDKAKSQRVKAYARKLVADHKAADRQLMSYARKRELDTKLEQVTAAPEQAKTDADMHARLMGETGSEFDQDFMSTMVEEHDKVIELVRTARDSATDPELRKLLDGMLPKLEKHRKSAQEIVDKHLKS